MKLSIITINRNNSKGLEITINSIVKQTFVEFEHLIIDGASTDESIDVIKKNENGKLKWLSEPDNGIYSAMNKGIMLAKGEYCLFLNSGDYLATNSVLQDLFNLPLCEDIIYGSILMSDGKRYDYPNEGDVTFRYFINNTLPHPCSLIRRTLFEKIGFYDENLQLVSDWKFFLIAICSYNAKIKKVGFVISIFDLNGISSQTTNKELIYNERHVTIQKHFGRFLLDYNEFDLVNKELLALRRNFVFRLMIKINKVTRKIQGSI